MLLFRNQNRYMYDPKGHGATRKKVISSLDNFPRTIKSQTKEKLVTRGERMLRELFDYPRQRYDFTSLLARSYFTAHLPVCRSTFF